MFGECARQRICDAIEQAAAPVFSIRLRLDAYHESAFVRPFVAQVDITAARPIRIQMTGATARETVDALQARTRARLRALAAPLSIPWEQGEGPATTLYLQPVQQRTIVRTKCFHLNACTPAEAVVEMLLMDYPFELFQEQGTGTDSVVYRDAHGGYQLTRIEARPHSAGTGHPLIVADNCPAETLNRDEALNRLSLSGTPFLVYRDRALDRGSVLYQRYDGHYGFMTSRR